MTSRDNIDWQQLIADGEWIGINSSENRTALMLSKYKICKRKGDKKTGKFRNRRGGVKCKQAVEKQLACFDLAQHERIFARDLKTYSVRPELGRRVNGVFQPPVEP